jgi:hypothetical protein
MPLAVGVAFLPRPRPLLLRPLPFPREGLSAADLAASGEDIASNIAMSSWES